MSSFSFKKSAALNFDEIADNLDCSFSLKVDIQDIKFFFISFEYDLPNNSTNNYYMKSIFLILQLDLQQCQILH